MRLCNIGLFFAFIVMCGMVILECRFKELDAVSVHQREYNRHIDNACEMAMGYVVEQMSGRTTDFNPDLVRQKFFEALWINFGVYGDQAGQKRLYEYTPLMVILGYRGAYFYYRMSVVSEDGERLIQLQKDYLPYEKTEDEIRIAYTMGKEIQLFFSDGSLMFEGYFADAPKVLTCLEDTGFEQRRIQTISELLREKMKSCMKKCVRAGKNLGGTTEFYFPVIEKEDWYRAIQDAGILVYFEGMPYSGTSMEYYRRFAFGGARVYKKE